MLLPSPPRWGTKPDGVCVVVGTLGSGFERNTTGDVIATASDLSPRGLQVRSPSPTPIPHPFPRQSYVIFTPSHMAGGPSPLGRKYVLP